MTVPSYRKEIRQTTLKKVARLLSDYYQSIEQKINQNDLKKETFDTVKEMDQIAGKEARDENDYSAIMSNQFNMFKEHLIKKRNEMPNTSGPISSGTDPVMMATVMINSLPKLQDFMEHTEFQAHDLKLIQQLIQFIKSIPSNNYGVQISKSDQIDAVKLYYEKLFIPIQKTIETQQFPNQNAQAPGNQQQQMMQQMMQAQQGMQQGMQPPMQQLMQQQQQQQLQRPQITPSVSQQMSPSQDLNAMPRQMPTPQGGIQNPLMQPPQPPQQPGLAVPVQQPAQGQQPQQIPQQMQQIQSQQSVQQLQQHNPRSPQQKPRSPQMMQVQQQQIHAMNMPMNPQQPSQTNPQQPSQPTQQMQGRPPMQRTSDTPASSSDIIRSLFSNVRADCAVFYSTPHPPHF